MIKLVVSHIKLILLFLIDLVYRIEKFLRFILTGKHEVERILETYDDIYGKTIKIDEWLSRTHCKPLNDFLKKNFGEDCAKNKRPNIIQDGINKILNDYYKPESKADAGHRVKPKQKNIRPGSDKKTQFKKSNSSYLENDDPSLEAILKELTQKLSKLIIKTKGLNKRLSSEMDDSLKDSLYRILGYKMSIIFAERLASTKYDSTLETHTGKLMNLWNNLVLADQGAPINRPTCNTKVFPPELSITIDDKGDIVSHRWSHIGFQGEDPGTDFRGMGLLGLMQLEYLSRKPKDLARDLLLRSLDDQHSYPFAIVGINITYNLLNLFKDGSMKHLYFDTGDKLFRNKRRTLNVIKTFNDLYVELFLRFDCFWHDSRPETIFEFKGLMEKFVDIVKLDLSSRSFSLKFIY